MSDTTRSRSPGELAPCGSNPDLSRRKQAEEALRQATEQLRIVTDSMAVPVTRCGRDLRYRWVSKAYAELLRRTPEELVGRPIRDVLGEETFGQLRPHFEQALAGERVSFEEVVNYPGVGPRWVKAVYTPTFGAAGVPDGWVAVVLDETEQKRAEEALPEAEAARDVIDRQVAQLSRMVDDLLDVSRITRGKVNLRKERLGLAQAVASAVETSRPFIEARGHELKVALPPEPLPLEGDPARLAQVFLNFTRR
jgi:PAS domain S-box-containing protein